MLLSCTLTTPLMSHAYRVFSVQLCSVQTTGDQVGHPAIKIKNWKPKASPKSLRRRLLWKSVRTAHSLHQFLCRHIFLPHQVQTAVFVSVHYWQRISGPVWCSNKYEALCVRVSWGSKGVHLGPQNVAPPSVQCIPSAWPNLIVLVALLLTVQPVLNDL